MPFQYPRVIDAGEGDRCFLCSRRVEPATLIHGQTPGGRKHNGHTGF